MNTLISDSFQKLPSEPSLRTQCGNLSHSADCRGRASLAMTLSFFEMNPENFNTHKK